MGRIIFLSVIAIAVTACVDKLTLPESTFEKKTVVDGLITESAGPHTISLFYSAPLEDEGDFEPITDASVIVRDGRGTEYIFTQTSPGNYATQEGELIGKVGETYTLEVNVDGKRYVSTPQTMFPAGAVSNVYAEFEQGSINDGEIGEPHDSWTVWIDADGGEGNDQVFFRWRSTGTYEVRTFPELRTIPDPGDPTAEIPAPLPCSGFVYDSLIGGIVPVGQCECCSCWVTEYNDSPILSEKDYVVDNQFKRVFVSRIPFDERRFYNKYHILVEQLSISEDVYAFWKLVKSQQQSGGIFQPNTSRVTGNIYNAADPDDDVMGIFVVSAITQNELFIDRFDAPVPVGLIDTSYSECYKTYPGASNVRPPFW